MPAKCFLVLALGSAIACQFNPTELADTSGTDSDAAPVAVGADARVEVSLADAGPDAAPVCTSPCETGLSACIAETETCECSAGILDCMGSCIDGLEDPLACGATCGDAMATECSADQVCSAGACQCRPGLRLTDGGCINASTDPEACSNNGQPPVECEDGEVCTKGICKSSCGPGLSECPTGKDGMGACVDTAIDNQNCGGCDISCAVNEVCGGGQCRVYEPAGTCDACPCPRCSETGAQCGTYADNVICLFP